MGRFFNRDDFSKLESDLRDHRPEPNVDLIDGLVTRIGRETVPTPVPAPFKRRRFAAAIVFAVVILVALAAFGGVGYAKSSVVSAAKSSKHAVSAVVHQGNSHHSNSQGNTNHPNHDPPWMHQYSHFVLVCYPFSTPHKTVRHTIVVPPFLVPFLVPPGTLGPCGVPFRAGTG